MCGAYTDKMSLLLLYLGFFLIINMLALSKRYNITFLGQNHPQKLWLSKAESTTKQN